MVYSENFIDSYFKLLLNKIHVPKGKLGKVEKKVL